MKNNNSLFKYGIQHHFCIDNFLSEIDAAFSNEDLDDIGKI